MKIIQFILGIIASVVLGFMSSIALLFIFAIGAGLLELVNTYFDIYIRISSGLFSSIIAYYIYKKIP